MDLRRTEASALFSPSSTSTSTTPSRKNSPRLNAPITATHAYIIAGDNNGDKNDKNNVQTTGVKDNKVLNVLSGSTSSEVEKEGEVEGEEGKVLKQSTLATVSPALSYAYSATSLDSDDDIISGGYRGGGGGDGGKGRGGQKGNEDDGIKAHGPTLLGSARSAQLHAMYTSSESKGDGKGKCKGEKKEEGMGERKGEGKGDEKGGGMEEMEKGEGKEEVKAEAKKRGHTHDSNETDVVWLKSVNGIETKVIGGSHIFNNTHITQLEAVSRVILCYQLNNI